MITDSNGHAPAPAVLLPVNEDALADMLTAAESLAARAQQHTEKADELATAISREMAADAQEAARLEQAKREVEALEASRAERAGWMVARNKEAEAERGEALRLRREADYMVDLVDRERARAAAPLAPPAASWPIGSLEMCPGCRQPVGWDGLGWTHAGRTDCAADLSGFAPQQDGGDRG